MIAPVHHVPPAPRGQAPGTESVPPHDAEAETLLLAARVADGAAARRWIARAGVVRVSDFYVGAHRTIAGALDTVEARGHACDAVALRAEVERVGTGEGLGEALAAVLAAATSVTVANTEVYAERVVRLAMAREMRRAAFLVAGALARGDDSGLAEASAVIEGVRAQFAGAPAASRLRFLSLAEVVERARARPREWLLDRVVPFGAIVLLVGTGKVSGKSTLTWAAVAGALRGEDLFGNRLPCGPVGVVVLTEEGEIDLAERLASLGVAVDDAACAVLPVASCSPRPSWAEACAAALATARSLVANRRCSRALLVVDTWAKWTRLENENDASQMLGALDALEPARAEGITVLLLHHPSKAEGREGGNASRGNSALPGEVDATIELRNPRSKSEPGRRVLHVESRAAGVFDMAVTLVPGDRALGVAARYEQLGDEAEVSRAEYDRAVVVAVERNPGATGPEVATAAAVREGTVQATLPRLAATGRIQRTGRGRAGSPYRYWSAGETPADAESPSPARSRPSPARGDPGEGGGEVSSTPAAPL